MISLHRETVYITVDFVLGCSSFIAEGHGIFFLNKYVYLFLLPRIEKRV
jgi:hypothetical protein